MRMARNCTLGSTAPPTAMCRAISMSSYAPMRCAGSLSPTSLRVPYRSLWKGWVIGGATSAVGPRRTRGPTMLEDPTDHSCWHPRTLRMSYYDDGPTRSYTSQEVRDAECMTHTERFAINPPRASATSTPVWVNSPQGAAFPQHFMRCSSNLGRGQFRLESCRWSA
jgi:hypothetical protein